MGVGSTQLVGQSSTYSWNGSGATRKTKRPSERRTQRKGGEREARRLLPSLQHRKDLPGPGRPDRGRGVGRAKRSNRWSREGWQSEKWGTQTSGFRWRSVDSRVCYRPSPALGKTPPFPVPADADCPGINRQGKSGRFSVRNLPLFCAMSRWCAHQSQCDRRTRLLIPEDPFRQSFGGGGETFGERFIEAETLHSRWPRSRHAWPA